MADASVTPSERWLPVVGWEGLYEVSDFGNVRSIRRRTRSGWRGGRVLKHYVGPGTHGYPTVGLSCGAGMRENRFVHQLVLEAFDKPCPPGQESRHGPAGKLNAGLLNLCYGTRSENVRDRTRDGQDNRGERSGQAKLNRESVAEIRRRVAAGESQRSVARRFGVVFQTVSVIVAGKSWVDAGGPVQENRGGRGEGNARARLTWETVGEIRRRYAAGEFQHDLAQEYGVSAANISMIVTGKTWKKRTN